MSDSPLNKISLPIIIMSASIIATSVLIVMELDWATHSYLVLTLMGLIFYLAVRAEMERREHAELNRMRAAYDQLDAQAKLIIRTDLELHRTQEELDRKLASLYALHELGRQLGLNVHPDEIYSRIDAQLIMRMGFTKGLVGSIAADGQFVWRAQTGVTEGTAAQIHQALITDGWLKDLAADPSPRGIHSHASPDARGAKMLKLLEASSAVVASIAPRSGAAGCLILARHVPNAVESRGDEEVIAILATQLTTAIENSALYAEVWESSHELETKVHERTRELADANAQLIRASKAKSDFVSAVSHELRTPLAAIKGYASLLRSGQFGPLLPPQTERLGKVEKHADLLAQFINDLLDIARIESGRITMELRPIETREFFSSLIDVVKPQLDAKHIKLSFNSDGVDHLIGDPIHLPRVFINLLSNAIKYTPDGGAIDVTMQRHVDEILTRVQDTGCGIDAKELPKLFQEFYRAAHPINEQVKGTGLGLVLVKRILEAHGGRIDVTSELGRGTTFVFTLPAELPAPPPPGDAPPITKDA